MKDIALYRLVDLPGADGPPDRGDQPEDSCSEWIAKWRRYCGDRALAGEGARGPLCARHCREQIKAGRPVAHFVTATRSPSGGWIGSCICGRKASEMYATEHAAVRAGLPHIGGMAW